MQHDFEQYPDKPVLPDGWKEHYDSQRNIRYYVDLTSDPPRISLVHPDECKDHRDKKLQANAITSKPNKESLRLSPTQRPIGPRESVSSSNGSAHPSQRPRRATVAQQLYASSIVTSPKESATSENVPRSGVPDDSRKALALSRRPSVSATAVPEAINTPPSSANSSSSTSSSGCVSPTSPISPMPGLDVHNPRNFLDCTRLTGTRRVTYSGPQPLLAPRNTNRSRLPPIIIAKDDPGLGVDAFYPASVKTTPSPMPLRSTTDPNNFSLPALMAPDNYQMKETAYPGSGSSSNDSISQMKTHVLSPPLSNPATTSALTRKSPRLEHCSSSPIRPTLPREAPKKESSANSKRPLPPTTKHIQLTAPPHPPPTIMQPKPMRPLGSVSLNLQVQVTGVDSESSPEQSADGAKKKKNHLLKSFNIGVTKNAKGKTPIRTIYDRQMLSSSPIPDEFPTGAIQDSMYY